MPSDPDAVAREILDLAAARSATLGAGRLVCLDGPAGSGKTSLAAAIAGRAGCPVVHMDDLFPGWDGLSRVAVPLEGLLRPLAAGRPGSYRQFDWSLDRYRHTVQVDPVPLLVLEGVGSGSAVICDLVTVLVWVEADRELRRRRGVGRDPGFAEHWDHWADQEAHHFATDRTQERADLVVDTSP